MSSFCVCRLALHAGDHSARVYVRRGRERSYVVVEWTSMEKWCEEMEAPRRRPRGRRRALEAAELSHRQERRADIGRTEFANVHAQSLSGAPLRSDDAGRVVVKRQPPLLRLE